MLWRFKMLAKIVLSRVPLAYEFWRKLGIFQHGHMHVAEYSLGVVTSHIDRLGGRIRVNSATCLEFGPGDSLASALIAHTLGAARVILVDAGNFANRDIRIYRQLTAELAARGFPVADFANIETVDDMLRLTNAEYLTSGLSSLQKIKSGSVDLIWSQAVLEHVRYHEMDAVFSEFHRILKPNGAMSHRIDFRDHLGGSLNNLRFSRRLWESEFMVKSGFYTNRVRQPVMLRALQNAGFDVNILETIKWDRLPLVRCEMDTEFSGLPEIDLLVSGCDIVARPI
jgi:SAM-dependent methyltransferase